MIDLIYTELLKLKRSNMLIVSILGVCAPALLNYFMMLKYYQLKGTSVQYGDFFQQSFLFLIFLVGPMLWGLLATYVFSREYQDDTLKNLLTIPVGRTQLLFSKLIVLLGWVLALMVIILLFSIVLGLLGGFEGLSLIIFLGYLKKYLIGGALLLVLTVPVVLLTLIFKNYVISIGFTISISLTNIIILNSKYFVIFPWSAILAVLNPELIEDYPYFYSWLSIGLVSVVSFITTLFYFNRTDIR